MNKIEILNTSLLEARKSGDKFKANILSTMKGEVENQAKNKPGVDLNELIESYALKSKKNLSEFKPNGYDLELEIISPFLPKEVTREDIENAIQKLRNSGVNEKAMLGNIMKQFKGVDVKMVKDCLGN